MKSKRAGLEQLTHDLLYQKQVNGRQNQTKFSESHTVPNQGVHIFPLTLAPGRLQRATVLVS